MPRRKRLHVASTSLMKREWVENEVVDGQSGITYRPDGTFAMKMRHDCVLLKSQIDEIVDAVTTETETCYVKFSCDENDGRMVVSVETTYPPEAHMRRKERLLETSAWYRNLDTTEKCSATVFAREMWSNELREIPAFDKRRGISVPADMNAIQIVNIGQKKAYEPSSYES